MRDVKNVEGISVFEFVWNCFRCSEPNAFEYCWAFGLSETVCKYKKRWVTLPESGLGRRSAPRAKRKIIHHSVKFAQPNLQES